jgi:hypothetical protein
MSFTPPVLSAESSFQIYGDLERLAATTQQHPVAGNHGLIRVPTATAPPHQASGKIRNPFAAKYEDRRIVSTHHLVANRPSDYLDNPHVCSSGPLEAR